MSKMSQGGSECKLLPSDTVKLLRSSSSISTFSQCVEELVMNSIDGGAKTINISIDISLSYIKVDDDGSGIHPSDLTKIGAPSLSSRYSSTSLSCTPKFYGSRGNSISSIINLSSGVEFYTHHSASNRVYYKRFSDGSCGSGKIKEVSLAKKSTRGLVVIVHGFLNKFPVRRGRMSGVDVEELKDALLSLYLINPSVKFVVRDNSNSSVILHTFPALSVGEAYRNLHKRPTVPVYLSHETLFFSAWVSPERSRRTAHQHVYLNKRELHRGRIHCQIAKILDMGRRGRNNDSISNRTSHQNKSNPSSHPVFIIEIECGMGEYDLIYDGSKRGAEFRDWEKVNKGVEALGHKLRQALNQDKHKIIGLPPSSSTSSSRYNVLGEVEIHTEPALGRAVKSKMTEREMGSLPQFDPEGDSPPSSQKLSSSQPLPTTRKKYEGTSSDDFEEENSSLSKKAKVSPLDKYRYKVKPFRHESSSKSRLKPKSNSQDYFLQKFQMTPSALNFIGDSRKRSYSHDSSSSSTSSTHNKRARKESGSFYFASIDEDITEENEEEENLSLLNNSQNSIGSKSRGDTIVLRNRSETRKSIAQHSNRDTRETIAFNTRRDTIVSNNRSETIGLNNRRDTIVLNNNRETIDLTNISDTIDLNNRSETIDVNNRRDNNSREAIGLRNRSDTIVLNNKREESIVLNTKNETSKTRDELLNSPDSCDRAQFPEDYESTVLSSIISRLSVTTPSKYLLTDDEDYAETNNNNVEDYPSTNSHNFKNYGDTHANDVEINTEETFKNETEFVNHETSSRTSSRNSKTSKTSRTSSSRNGSIVNNTDGENEPIFEKSKYFGNSLPDGGEGGVRKRSCSSRSSSSATSGSTSLLPNYSLQLTNFPQFQNITIANLGGGGNSNRRALSTLFEAKDEENSDENSRKNYDFGQVFQQILNKNNLKGLNQNSSSNSDNSSKNSTSFAQKSEYFQNNGSIFTKNQNLESNGSGIGENIGEKSTFFQNNNSIFATNQPNQDSETQNTNFLPDINETSSEHIKSTLQAAAQIEAHFKKLESEENSLGLEKCGDLRKSQENEGPPLLNINNLNFTQEQYDAMRRRDDERIYLYKRQTAFIPQVKKNLTSLLNESEKNETIKIGENFAVSEKMGQLFTNSEKMGQIFAKSEKNGQSFINSEKMGQSFVNSEKMGQIFTNSSKRSDLFTMSEKMGQNSTNSENMGEIFGKSEKMGQSFINSEKMGQSFVNSEKMGQIFTYSDRRGENFTNIKKLVETENKGESEMMMMDENSQVFNLEEDELLQNITEKKVSSYFDKSGRGAVNEIFRKFNEKYEGDGKNTFGPPTTKLLSQKGNLDLAATGNTILGSSIVSSIMQPSEGNERIKWRHVDETSSDNPSSSSLSAYFNLSKPLSTIGQLPLPNMASSTQLVFIDQCLPKESLKEIQVVKQIDRKFIAGVVEVGGKEILVLFDQHAVHERIRLENLISLAYEDDTFIPPNDENGPTIPPGLHNKKIKGWNCRPPVRLLATGEEVRILETYRQSFYRIGLEYDLEGQGLVSVKTIPEPLSNLLTHETNSFNLESKLKNLVHSLIEEQVKYIKETRGFVEVMPNGVLKALRTLACYGAIKFGDKLELSKCVELIQQLSHCNLPFQCAHGRPSLTIVCDLTSIETQNPTHTEYF